MTHPATPDSPPTDRRSAPALAVVLLDIDGTLLDSNEAHARCWMEALAAHGFPVAYEQVRPLIGMGGDKVLPLLTGLPSEAEPAQRIAAHRAERFLSHYLATLRPTRGARAFVQRILDEGLTPVVATSAGDELPDLLRQAGVHDLVRLSAGSDDAAHSKPDNDIVEAALHKAGVTASQAVMVGDTPYDARAAAKAGVPSILLRCGGWWGEADLAARSTVHDDPMALVDAWATAFAAHRVD